MFLFAMILLALSPVAPATAAGPNTTAPAPTRPEGIGIRLLDIPASAQNDPRARTYIVDRLAPGTEINRRVRVENNTGTPQTIRIYPGAAHIDNGDFIGDDASVKNDLTTWTRLAQPQVDLAPGGHAEVMASIKVPADAPESEQYGAIWAEVRSPADRGGVAQANRVGVRIYLSVGPGNGNPADFTVTSVTAGRSKDESPQLSALITNTGGRALDITGELRLTAGPGGLSAGPFNVPKAATVAPGNAQTVVFTPPRILPNGPWTAQIKIKSGLLEREATATVTFPEAGPGEPVAPVINDDGTQWALLVAIAAGLFIAVLAAVGLVLYRKRRSRAAAALARSRGSKRNSDRSSKAE
ncbi:DUF916 domain-containing protein [Arthrobacter sp. C9C5]|uniref:DUF916 domain-containing protein n=1 Tax=Arthrobacter sp. C9C5 TaxID=2735267 RepID=UPI00201BA30C|nr:DUF916 domain-containing protein [Arthrobacter sp. C9C5]